MRRRREFITLLGGAATAALPLTARAQQAGNLDHWAPGSGHTFSIRPVDSAFCAAATRARLDQGRNIVIEYRWGEGRSERYAEIAAELVQLKADIIVVGGNEAAIAVKQATSVIPTVFAAAAPIGTGLSKV